MIILFDYGTTKARNHSNLFLRYDIRLLTKDCLLISSWKTWGPRFTNIILIKRQVIKMMLGQARGTWHELNRTLDEIEVDFVTCWECDSWNRGQPIDESSCVNRNMCDHITSDNILSRLITSTIKIKSSMRASCRITSLSFPVTLCFGDDISSLDCGIDEGATHSIAILGMGGCRWMDGWGWTSFVYLDSHTRIQDHNYLINNGILQG